MNKRDWRKVAFILTIIGCIQFLVLSSIAMLCYGGGTRINPDTTSYIFFMNFFSDLGRTESFGNPNTISFILFVTTLFLASIALLAYFIAIPGVISEDNPERMRILTVLGIINAGFFGAIALTPANLFPQLHDFIVLLAFILLFSVSMLMYFTFKKVEFIPRIYRVVFLIFSCLIALYGLVSLVTAFFPENLLEFSLFLRVLIQKVVIYYLITCFTIQSLGALKNYPMVTREGRLIYSKETI
ncbi:MAG: hypothetical protein ACFFDT_04240 [Candidatus Hodarchaeota archaeon]